jgi:hypothetical protein
MVKVSLLRSEPTLDQSGQAISLTPAGRNPDFPNPGESVRWMDQISVGLAKTRMYAPERGSVLRQVHARVPKQIDGGFSRPLA